MSPFLLRQPPTTRTGRHSRLSSARTISPACDGRRCSPLPEKYQASVKGYYQLVSGLDRVVGEIRTELRRLGLEKNTVIIFSSDNGFFLGELGMAHKWYGQDPSVRVPLVVYDPRNLTGQGGRVETALALNIDIAPTILAIAGVPIPPQMEGSSLIPLVHGQSVAWRSDYLFEHLLPDPMIRRSEGVIGGRYKYLRYIDPNPNYEVLYDLAIDPNETKTSRRIPPTRRYSIAFVRDTPSSWLRPAESLVLCGSVSLWQAHGC